MNNLTVLVTGGCGFIGSHLVRELLKQNVKKVCVVDNLSTGRMKNIEDLLEKHKNIQFFWGDITNLETCRKVMAESNVDIICHQAAVGSVPASIIDPLRSHNNNVNGFLNILLVAKEMNIKRVVYASSSSVYGNDDSSKKIENKTGELMSPYALTKYVDELYGGIFASVYQMEVIGLRYFNVFGPGQNPEGAYAAVIPKFIKALSEDKRPTIYGDGSFSRDFTYVDNVVSANLLAMTTTNKECFGEVFNVGAGGSISVLKVFEIIREKMDKKNIEPIFCDRRLGDVAHSCADVSKANKLLGYEVLVQFEDGIKRLV